MDLDELYQEKVRDLQRDLNDGDDLAMALALIGDVLHRRIRRVRKSLEALDTADGFDTVRRRVRDTLARYESELDAGRTRLQGVIEDFQDALDREAERLAEAADEELND